MGFSNEVPFSVEGSPELTYRKPGHFPGGPAVRTLPPNAGDLVSSPGLGTEVPHPVCFHLFPPGLPPRESFPAILGKWGGCEKLARVAEGDQNRPHPLGTGVLHTSKCL